MVDIDNPEIPRSAPFDIDSVTFGSPLSSDPEEGSAREACEATGPSVRRLRLGIQGDGSTLFVDLAKTTSDPSASTLPTMCPRTDGVSLFYPGQVNMLFGEPETGKTWVALHAVHDVLMNDKGLAVLIDLDHQGPGAVKERLLDLGVPLGTLTDPSRFLFTNPGERDHLLGAVDHARDLNPALVVIDCVGELIPLMKGKSGDPDAYTRTHRRVALKLAECGAAVVLIDHVSKAADTKDSPTGTAAKTRACGGAMIKVEKITPFIREHGGSSSLTISKDRHGHLGPRCVVQNAVRHVGVFQLRQDGAQLIAEIVPPDPDLLPSSGSATRKPNGTPEEGYDRLVRECAPDAPPTTQRGLLHG